MITVCHISAEDFLVDVKAEIKKQFKNQENFADILFLSRKQLNKVLNNEKDLTIGWINELCGKLGMDFRTYLQR